MINETKGRENIRGWERDKLRDMHRDIESRDKVKMRQADSSMQSEINK